MSLSWGDLPWDPKCLPHVLTPLPRYHHTIALPAPGRRGGIGNYCWWLWFGQIEHPKLNRGKKPKHSELLVLNKEKANIQNMRTGNAAGITLIPFPLSRFIGSFLSLLRQAGQEHVPGTHHGKAGQHSPGSKMMTAKFTPQCYDILVLLVYSTSTKCESLNLYLILYMLPF